ncbi:enoyl-CoA hydratase/isomerase family protein [Archangium violaceum]|uniref:enoyl-CoA hydratase/isomerase family protein n=1 Tax=Archangium violaceum TaxID=83451 RepID=UPI0022863E8A|nr:enoyl-CoA hydratase/isomerase family protein [Archangium violaceum]
MEAGEGVVRYQAQGGQALLTLDRPKARNALSPEVLRELMAALDRAEADAAVRVVVLTGAGEKVFCAGGDLGQSGGGGRFSRHPRGPPCLWPVAAAAPGRAQAHGGARQRTRARGRAGTGARV